MQGIVNMKIKTLGANLTLILVAFIWGSAFVAQNSAGDVLGTFSINFSRYIVAGVALIPVYLFFSRHENKKTPEYTKKLKTSLTGGLFCGLALFAASAFQQLGIIYGKDEGKAGFITVMYVLMVPIIGLFFKKRVPPLTWIAVALSPVGLYFLCMEGSLIPEKSDIFLFICALLFSVHIMVIDRFSKDSDGVLMSCVQFFAAGLLSFVCTLIFEAEYIPVIPSAWIEILYLGIMSSGVAYTLQIIAQKNTNPTVASILMSLESVFAMLCGAVFSQTMPQPKKVLGAVIIFTAVILAQLPTRTQNAECS